MNDYARAIGILTHGSIDSYKIAVKLAQTNPALFCKLATDDASPIFAGDNLTPFQRNLVDVARMSKVSAVKMYREEVQCGLKEALDYINNLMERV